MPTHVILCIHLGPCLDQHPACDLVAMLGSQMEGGALEGLQEWDVLGGNSGVAGAGAKSKRIMTWEVTS